MKRLALLVCLVLALTANASEALAAGNKPGNSVDAKRCQNYQDWYTRDGQAFSSQSECAAYAAKKGAQLINEAALDCLNDGWETLGPDETRTFADEQECVDHAVGGGLLVAYADVRMALVDSAAVMCVGPAALNCISKDIWVYNDGPVAVTVSVDISDTYAPGPVGVTSYLYNNNFCTVSGGGGNVTASCTVTVAAGGGGAFLFRVYAYTGGSHTGSASVTSSSSPDPDNTNNTVAWNFTAPGGGT
jgi:hypothetical protein